MTLNEHKEIHLKLHQSFIELLNDYYEVTKQPLDRLTLKELFGWSLLQTTNPTSSTTIDQQLKNIEEASSDNNDNDKIINSHIITETPTPQVKPKRKRKSP